MRTEARAWRVLGVSVWLGVLALVEARAGMVFLPGRMEQGRFVSGPAATNPCFQVFYSTVKVAIEDGAAVTDLRDELGAGGTGPVCAVGLLPLPADVEPAGVRVALRRPDGGETNLPCEVLNAAAAGPVLEAFARASGQAGLLSRLGRPALLLPAIQLAPRQELRVVYRQPLREAGGLWTYACPLPDAAFTGRSVERLAFEAVLKSRTPIRAVLCPTHEVALERGGPREVRVTLQADRFAGGPELELHYVLDADPLGLRAVTHRLAGDAEGYFMLLGNPSGGDGAEAALPKDVIFALDTSGSMRGEKMEQARAALAYCLRRLDPRDGFNIIAFGTAVTRFAPDVVAPTQANLEQAEVFVDELVPAGLTNVDGALRQGLDGKPRPGRPRIMLFLTDGTPTAGELGAQEILAQVKAQGLGGTRIYAVGLGHDVNTRLLDGLAEITDGASEYLDPGQEIDVKVAALFNRISYPVLANVQLDFGGLAVNSVYPRKVSALFRGGDFVVLGRYRGGGRRQVTVSGELAGKPRSYTYTLDFPEAEAAGRAYVASLWAARKVGFLLQEVRLHGQDKELIGEIVQLSRQFGIVTEYTAFIADAGGNVSLEEATAQATDRMQNAHREIGGKWAVAQARNDQALQQKLNAAQAAAYEDRDGRTRSVSQVRQVGRRVFYRQADGNWVDAEAAGERKTRAVQLFSDEYFALLRSDPAFAEAQQVGGPMTLNVGAERIEVKK